MTQRGQSDGAASAPQVRWLDAVIASSLHQNKQKKHFNSANQLVTEQLSVNTMDLLAMW